jgi:signal peptidase I
VASRRRDENGSIGAALGWTALIAGLLALLTIVAALAFSVTVKGHSMEPTVHEGDRLLMKFWDRGTIERFDLVEARVGVAKTPVVKRVVGLPGDTVSIRFVDGAPVVAVTPAGSDKAQYVVNPRWTGQVGDRVAPCCEDDGTAGTKPHQIVVPDGEYWLLGDNWGQSDDSRTYGFVPAKDIGGQHNLRLRPLGAFGSIENPAKLADKP